MNTITVNDIQQRGIAALAEATKIGQVQIVEPNHPIYIVLTETEYASLQVRSTQKVSVLDLFAQAGTRSRADIDAAFKAERRPFGLCAGEFVVPDGFDEPLVT